MTSARRRWSYSTGERGRNRVRAFEHSATGLIFLEFADSGHRKRIALGHRDRAAAKAKAEELAAALRRVDVPASVAPTLLMLFDIYGREMTPTKGESAQRHDRRATQRFLEFLGPHRRVATLSRREWDGFIRWRRAGGDRRAGLAHGRPVRDRVVEADLRFLCTVLNWAAAAGLLDRNPLRGLPWPKERSPRRPMLADAEYRALSAVAPGVSETFALALVLAHETGHRISAVRRLRWSDVNWGQRTIRWRAEHDKIGFEHVTPLSPPALGALEQARRERLAVGEAWIVPAPEDPGRPCSIFRLRDWWQRAERRGGLERVPGRGWHSLRRKFATELKQVPLADLCYLGGWKSPQTVLACYQRPDQSTLVAALAARHAMGLAPTTAIDTATDTTMLVARKEKPRLVG
jgi:integrase